ncbi:hypothetical protein O181_084448 [Austropuccinia psidii MF-1]|uniref:Uncharacterized protein n=1 Tax=Austropuccinia psidii MF-1 TaxID=1389203 RepID=A0A9Q3IKN2_9BASI|nr:hypothetical protein [Austropuccinia psidii MF-1]
MQNLALGKPPGNANNSLCLSRLPKLHMQILTLVQVPDNSNSSLHRGILLTSLTVPYASAGSQCFTCKSLHCAGSQKFEQFIMPVQASNNSHANPYACTGSLHFTQTSFHLYRFLKIQKIPYTWAASQQF